MTLTIYNAGKIHEISYWCSVAGFISTMQCDYLLDLIEEQRKALGLCERRVLSLTRRFVK